MSNLTIFILSSNNDTVAQFRDTFLSSGYGIQLFDEINAAIKNISKDNSGLILIDYEMIVNAERKVVIDLFKMVKMIKAVVFNVPEDTDRRLAFYELGATRVFDKSNSIEEIAIRIQWLLQVLSEKDESHRLYSKGSLENIPLTTLINTLGKENRSGVLKIVTENNSGKIYFNDGDITSAEVGSHSGERAVIHMLFWEKGNFSFSSLKKEAPAHNVLTSNMGLRILAEHYQRNYVSQVEQLGSVESIIRVQNTGDLFATLDTVDREFIEFIQRPHPLYEVLENPFYTSFETMEKLILLKANNFLVIKEPSKVISEEKSFAEEVKPVVGGDETGFLLRTQDVNQIKRNLGIGDNNTGKIIIFSRYEKTIAQFFSDLGLEQTAIRKDKKFEAAQVMMGKNLALLFIALTISPQVMATLQSVSDKVSGQIFLIENSKELDFEYLSYIIRRIFAYNPVPSVIAISQLSSQKELNALKPKLKLPREVRMISSGLELGEKAIRQILLALEPVSEEKAENNQPKEGQK